MQNRRRLAVNEYGFAAITSEEPATSLVHKPEHAMQRLLWRPQEK